ncbi:SDR family oxidoreductase [Rubinisphaera margarita]|uniref:SDR family oxidoreductase n=1 Tax=Rubinisphaera margarita TaxID=2909586 RepID=UPI001EE84006|nr:SDR family oxidoreductase [Rubinisphaera margarita]MCG6156442.1 SDR family oxidoreductase [Rubinisphaera margarita]
MRFANKVVVVTGATSGIGRETALRFAAEGARVVLAGRREKEGQEAVTEIQAAGGTALFVQTDVAREGDVRGLIERTVSEYGRLDIAFNNAGVEHAGPVTDVTVEDYERVFGINVLGVLLCQKYEIPAMLRSGGGAIINTSSVLGHIAMPGAALYNASKHAVEGITRTTALEYAEQGIRVNSVAPAVIGTDMIERFAGPNGREEMKGLHPIGRIGRPEEVAEAVLYLASDSASFTTGISLPVDGGFLAR